MFRTLIHPSSGACDNSVELPHWSYCSWFDVCWSFGVVELERLQPATRIPLQPSHTENPTHIETRTHNQCGDTIGKSQAPHDGYQPATQIPPQPATPKLQHTSKQEHTTNVVIQ